MLRSDSKSPEADQPQAFFGLGFDPLTDTVAFPHLSEAELEEVAPFGERCAFAENEPLVSAGDYPFNSFVVLSGRVRAVDASTGERVVCLGYGAGYFTRLLYRRLWCSRAGTCWGPAPRGGFTARYSDCTHPEQRNAILSKILMLHGDADLIASFDQVSAFRDEMRSAEANWKLDIYGGARHSFTGEGVLDQTNPEAGLHPQSEARSWKATLEFLAKVLDVRH